jgi:superoxide dismutase, Fe-Mn family
MSTFYKLPELTYDYPALEPHISARIMELHHGKHHAAYVKGANEAATKLEEARTKKDFASVAALERALAFNVSGHVLHSLFWENLGPKGGGQPDGAFGGAITRDFGTFDAFKAQLTQAAATTMGSGWGALVWEPLARRLLVTQLYDHQGNVVQGSQPIMVLDAWEHAYYLQYENRKAEFFDAVWNVWSWSAIARRFETVAVGASPGTSTTR